MRKTGYFTLLFFITTLFVQAQDGFSQAKNRVKGLMTEEKGDTSKYNNFVPEVIPNNAFSPGEIVEYEMRYGFVVGAKAKAHLKEIDYKGRKVYHSVATAKTVGIADVLFEVNDRYESYFIPETNLPLRSIRSIEEGGYKYYNEVEYDHENGKVYSSRSKKFKKVPGGVMDLVSAFYHSRRVRFSQVENVGDTVLLETYFEDKLYFLRVIYRGKENIKVKAGKIRCMKFNPVVEVGRVFDDENDVTFWVSDDPNYIPIRAQMNLIIGSFKADLVKYSGLRHPLALVPK